MLLSGYFGIGIGPECDVGRAATVKRASMLIAGKCAIALGIREQSRAILLPDCYPDSAALNVALGRITFTVLSSSGR